MGKYWGYIGYILGLYRVYIGIILGYIGIMENILETTVVGYVEAWSPTYSPHRGIEHPLGSD